MRPTQPPYTPYPISPYTHPGMPDYVNAGWRPRPRRSATVRSEVPVYSGPAPAGVRKPISITVTARGRTQRDAEAAAFAALQDHAARHRCAALFAPEVVLGGWWRVKVTVTAIGVRS